jgi:hypothetical protein
MNVFDGLHLYEIVLCVLGVILFLVLLVALIVLLMQGRSIKSLLLFFLIPVVMIGFPAVTKFKFDKDGVEIDKLALTVARNPEDVSAKTKLQMLVSEIKPRATESAEGLVKIARAEAVLGKPDQASATLDQALNRDSELKIAKDLKSRLKTLPSNRDEIATRHAVEANLSLKQ